MRLAIQLAKETKGQTTPNPPVGAVVVKNSQIVGLGSHLIAGEAHAEVIALDMAGERAKGATLYVTLEPCCHEGKTPPCVDYIINHKIKRVVIACDDRNTLVAGNGIKRLRLAGIDVEVGLLHEEAAQLYDVFFHYISTNLPFVTIKTATSLDGKTATHTNESKWITDEKARLDSHQYRHTHDAILVGVNTIIYDNPSLTTRIQNGKNPIRVILDTELRTPLTSNVITDEEAETWLIVGCNVADEQIKKYEANKLVRVIKMKSDKIDIEAMLQRLAEEQITSVFVEGGATVNGSFLRQRLINQVIMYVAPIVIGGKQAPTSFLGDGFAKLTDALDLEIEHSEMINGQIKIVATKGSASCLQEL